MLKLQSIFQKPYPLEENKTAQIKLAFIFSIVVFLLIVLIKPFGHQNGFNQLLLNSAIAALLTFTAIILDFFILFPLFPQFFKEEKWTIGREIIFTCIIITTIASINVIAGVFIWHSTFSFKNFLNMVVATAIIGIAPATVSILINQARLLKKYREEATIINKNFATNIPTTNEEIVLSEPVAQAKEIPITTTEPTIEFSLTEKEQSTNQLYITLQAENEKDNITILYHSFLAATSADNYVKVYYHENEKLKTVIIRSTLKRIEENTVNFSQLFRCHRTAIINIGAVQSVNGTAQGYRLQLQYLQEEIPVSRNLNQVLKEKLAAI